MSGWRRHHDPANGVAYVPAGMMDAHLDAGSLAEVVRFVAEAGADGVPLRACGSHWSMSAAVCDPDFTGRILETTRLDRTLYGVVPGCLADETVAALTAQGLPGEGSHGERNTLYHVEAGVLLRDLCTRLDGADPRWPAPTDRLGAPSLAGPWALPTLPAAAGQTLAGAISTGSHGADLDRPPLADAVQAVHLVGAGGHQYWIERARSSDAQAGPMCDARRLERALGDGVTVIQDDDALDSVAVSLGRMGVIYSVVLRVVSAYGLEETRVRRSWSEVRTDLLDPTGPLGAGRGLQVVVNPVAEGPDADRSAWVTRRRTIAAPVATADSRGRRRRARMRPVDAPAVTLRRLVCSIGGRRAKLAWGAVALLLAARAGAGRRVAGRVTGRAAERVAAPAFAGVLLGVAAAGNPGAAELTRWAAPLLARPGARRVFGRIIEGVIGAEQREHPEQRPLRAAGYAVLDRHDYTDRLCATGHALEVAFDAGTGLAVRFVDECVVRRVEQLLDPGEGGRPTPSATYVSIRYTGATRAHLGMQRWPVTCHVAVSGPRWFAGLMPLLSALERDALEMGGSVHWGQHNLIATADGTLYPGVERWRATLRTVTGHGDPGTFSTAYTRRLGLEV